MILNSSTECESQVCAVSAGLLPLIDSQQGLWSKAPCGFFKSFSYHGVYQGLTCLQVSGWLVDDQFARGILLDHEKAVITMHDGSNGNVCFPIHSGSITRELTGSGVGPEMLITNLKNFGPGSGQRG